MKRLLVAAVLATGLFGSIVGPARAEITPEQVRKAIDRGVDYLLGQQRNDGAWPDNIVSQPGGVSALCTLALLSAGVEPDDERMQRALGHLRKIKPQWTYVVSLQTMVFARAEPDKSPCCRCGRTRPRIRAHVAGNARRIDAEGKAETAEGGDEIFLISHIDVIR